MATGYGPSQRLIFSGKAAEYDVWETKFLCFMDECGLLDTIDPVDGIEPSFGTDKEQDKTDYLKKNRQAYCKLIQHLDSDSVEILISEDEVKNNGVKALRSTSRYF